MSNNNILPTDFIESNYQKLRTRIEDYAKDKRDQINEIHGSEQWSGKEKARRVKEVESKL